MRTLVHVSDLHFGRADMAVISSLLQALSTMRPDIIVISGDLTQRASAREFEEAQQFLVALDAANLRYFVIPGNHDIEPIYRPVGRVANAYKNYRRYISKHVEHFYDDGELAIASINTVKRTHPVNGRVGSFQLRRVRDWLRTREHAVKIVVTHHPLRRNHNRSSRLPCWGGNGAVRLLEDAGVDMYLCGHHHHSAVSHNGVVEVHAGTVSERLKGELPSFNLITIDSPRFTVTTYHWHASTGGFVHHSVHELTHHRKTAPVRERFPLKALRERIKLVRK